MLGLIGLFFFIAINPAIALVNDKLKETTSSHTYKIRETYIFGIIENKTNVQYDLVFSRPSLDGNHSFGFYRDIIIKGNIRELHIWLFPFLGNYFKIFQNGVFDIYNRNITLEIPFLLRGNIYDEPDGIWFVGRALGVTLTID